MTEPLVDDGVQRGVRCSGCPATKIHNPEDVDALGRCGPCGRAIDAWMYPSSAFSLDGPDAKPLNRCPFCLDGTVDGTDPCPRCWGDHRGDVL